MEAQKAIWFTFLIIIFILAGCNKPLKLEDSILKREVLNETQDGEAMELQFKGLEGERIKTPFFEPKPLSTPQYSTRLTTKPLPPPPTEEKKEEKPPFNFEVLVGVSGPVVLNVEAMPLNDFIIYALGELLKVPFIIDEEVMKMVNPVTLRLPRPLKPTEVLEAVVAHLEKLGLEVFQRGSVLTVTKPKPKPLPPPPRIEQVIIGETPVETSAQIAQFILLKYMRPHEIEVLLKDFTKGLNVEIRSYLKENALLLIGPGYQIKQVLELLSILDVPFFSGKKIYFYKATYWQVEEFVKELSSLLSKLGYPIANTVKEPGILFIPIKSLNNIIMVFPEEEAFKFALEWIKQLDSPEAAGTELKFFFYKPFYSKATDLAEAISKLLTGQYLKTQPIGPTVPQPVTGQASPVGKPVPQAQITTFSAQGISVSADERRNLLLISATPSQYQLILQMLRELDKPSKQVLIEATILELTLKDELRLGLEWYLQNRIGGGNYTIGQIFGVPKSPGLTFTLITDTQKFNLILNLFASRGLTNILSTPRLMVLDNQAATIQVGTDVPIITGEVTTAQAVTGGTAGVVRSIQYRNTGVILTVKPTIYTEGMLQLEITQEVSEMGTSPPGINSPTILVRKINTNIIAGDGQTIVLGGLISNTKGKEESKIPLFGDIPLLGNLFKSQSHEERKTELIVLLRPYIVKSLEEAKNITEELKERLKWLK